MFPVSKSLGPLLAMLAVAVPCCAEAITLRNFESINKSIASFNLDGVQFSDGSSIGWDQIRSGRVDASKQDAFDQYLKRLGEPLYRIRVRLQNQDYKDILEQAEQLYPRFQDRQSKTGYMVCQALMWARLAHGQRAKAVAPYLRCYAYLRAKRKMKEDIPGDRFLRFDPRTGMTPEIQPIWFDLDATKEGLDELGKSIATLPKPQPPAVRIYYATMAMAVGQAATGRRVLAGLGDAKGAVRELVLMANVQADIAEGKPSPAAAKLSASKDRFSKENVPLATYWSGIYESKNDLDRGILLLLRVAALHGDSNPDLAAASLAAAIRTSSARASEDPGQSKRASVLRRELLQSFPGTYHAQQILRKINVATDDPS